jgi:chromosome segregation ATPase
LLESDVRDVRVEASTAKDELSLVTPELAVMRSTNDTQRERIQQLEEELARSAANVDVAKANLVAAEARASSLGEKVSESKETISHLRLELVEKCHESDRLSSLQESSELKVAELQRSLDEALRGLTAEKTANDLLSDKLRESEEKVVGLETDVVERRHESELLSKDLSYLRDASELKAAGLSLGQMKFQFSVQVCL